MKLVSYPDNVNTGADGIFDEELHWKWGHGSHQPGLGLDWIGAEGIWHKT